MAGSHHQSSDSLGARHLASPKKGFGPVPKRKMGWTLKITPSGTLRLEFNQFGMSTAGCKETTTTFLRYFCNITNDGIVRTNDQLSFSHPQGESTSPSTSENEGIAFTRHETNQRQNPPHCSVSFFPSPEFLEW